MSRARAPPREGGRNIHIPNGRSDGPAVPGLPRVVGRSRAAVLASGDRVVREAQSGQACTVEDIMFARVRVNLPYICPVSERSYVLAERARKNKLFKR